VPNCLRAFVFGAALLLACRSEPRVMQVEITIEGMTCDSCVQAITHELERLEGVRSVDVDLDGGKARVTFTEGQSDPTVFEQTIEKIGYQATPGEAAQVGP
jgi:copper chaperone CopZ